MTKRASQQLVTQLAMILDDAVVNNLYHQTGRMRVLSSIWTY